MHLGTSFFFGPNLLMTAKHIIKIPWLRWNLPTNPEWDDSIFVKGTDDALKPLKCEFNFRLFAIQQLEAVGEAAFWLVDKMWLSPFTDLAILHVAPFGGAAKRIDWNSSSFPALNIFGAQEGEEVKAFGYPMVNCKIIEEPEKDSMGFDLKVTAAWTRGRVLSVAKTARGTPDGFPYFESDMQNHNQMSGGPVLNSCDEICGILVGKAPDPEPLPQAYNDFRTYSATMLPLMGMVMDGVPDPFAGSINFTELLKNIGSTPMLRSAHSRVVMNQNLQKLYREKIQSPDHSLLGDVSLAIGQDLCHAERFSEAIPHFEEALRIARVNGMPEKHPFIKEALYGIGYVKGLAV